MKRLSVEDAKSTLRSSMARAMAAALICAIDQCNEEGRPLNQLQQIDLATMHLMAYQEGVAEGEQHIEVGALIHDVSVSFAMPTEEEE